ncbi:arylsulfatase [Rhabdothermincola salaria]|uniref:arylsulfatase n=1 Tax=Rhabdothermincola salaria TaxID=2903142 RepID=UPI001E42143B|nr:arylsulfatase [Rhabdothermincola salaria]
MVLLDDLGFAHLGCFGSDLETPRIDALAAGGLRFTDFHVTPVCSPTRASLLTGRNHHTVGMRAVSNFNTGFPNMRGKVTDRATTMAEVLRDAGYATFAVGKWHLTPMHEASAAGPFDSWPLQRGFDRFYGFLDGETDQFSPDLVCDNHRIDPPSTPEDGYHLSEDLVDQAIAMIHDTVSIRPDRPFFTYLSFGATHAPHQAPEEYLARQRGRHDHGWDVARDRWFARQKDLGVIGADTQLAPRNPGVEPWDSLPDDDRRLAIRLQEAFAAFLEHTDTQIGRLVDALHRLGRLDNTLLVVLSDNGASQEGGPFGVLHEMKFFNGVLETPDRAVRHLDEIGGPRSHANYPWGWAQAGNTPFKWYKQNTHEGGVHVPLVVHWPKGVADPGGLRDGFTYVTDLAPTVFDAAGVTAPDTYRGVPQLPITGRSLAPSLSGRATGDTGRVQYFEMMGHRGLYLDGWKAVTRHQPGVPFDDDVWELYHLDVDRSECDDRAASEPQRLAAMVDRWWIEAAEHGVLPLDDRTVELFGITFAEHTPHPPSRRYTYRPPMTTLPAQVAAAIAGRSWDLAATVERSSRQDGVLYALGNGNAGLSLFVEGDQLVFDYNAFGEHTVVESTDRVPVGRSVLGVRFRRTGSEGEVTLVVDGHDCGTGRVPFVMRIVSSVGASVGHDQRLAVSDRHDGPFPFAGTLHRVDIALVDVRTPPDPAQAEAEARTAMGRQ